MIGILIGTGLFAAFFPALERKILNKGYFGEITWPELLRVNPWGLILPITLGILLLLFWIETSKL